MNKLQSFGKRYQAVILFGVAFGLLFMNFFDHRLSVLSTNRFIENEYGSERFVIHRLAYNLTHDPDDFGGLMVAYTMPVWDRTSSADFSAKVKELEEKIQNGDRPEIYPSHSAFQLTILQPVWAGLGALRDKVLSRAKPDSRVANRLQNDWAYYLYYISQALVAALSACVLTFFILWVRREFTLATAYITLAGILVLCPPLTYFGRNLWWMMGLWFIPMVIVFWGYALSRSQTPNTLQLLIIGSLAGAGVFAKVSCGYEFSSTIMMSALVPVIYYAVKNNVSRFDFIKAITMIGGLVFCGFLAAIYHHYNVLENAGFDALETIKSRFMMRASDAGATGDSEIAESVRSSVYGVIAKYVFVPQKIALPEILYLLPVIICLKNWKENAPLFSAMLVAFIGSLSMFIILKGHAYIHGFDTVAWYIPLNILIILWGAVWITKMPVSSKHHQSAL